MVGGEVIEVLRQPDRVWVNCQEVLSRGAVTKCAIYVERTEVSERIRVGDQLWWQGRNALWTPQEVRLSGERDGGCSNCGVCGLRCGVDYDVRIPRVGYSGVKHPAQRLVETAFGEESD